MKRPRSAFVLAGALILCLGAVVAGATVLVAAVVEAVLREADL